MAKESETQTRTPVFRFKVHFEEKPAEPIHLVAYVFGRGGRFIASCPVKEGVVEFTLPAEQIKSARIFFAPVQKEPSGTPPTLKDMERQKAYEPLWQFDPKKHTYDLMPIPQEIWKLWPFCECRVRGTVIKVETYGGVTYEKPVCNARVHICEVDPIFYILPKIPDLEIWKIRDDLLRLIEHGWPIPPEPPEEINPHIKDPGYIDPIPPFAQGVNVFGKFEYGMLNPQPIPPGRTLGSIIEKVSLNPQPEPPAARFLAIGDKVTLNPQPLPPKVVMPQFPQEFVNSLLTDSIPLVRQALIDNFVYLKPFLCWLEPFWPYLLTCNELTTVMTDSQGRFDTYIWYFCFGDHPDLYFWVDYSIGGSWVTVYEPRIYCNTYWDYVCGSDVTIRIYDDRVQGCDDTPVLIGKKVVVKSIGREVGMGEIYRETAGSQEGQVIPGWIHASRSSPFGATLEPRVDFGDQLVPHGITHYRWSIRPLGSMNESDWQVLDATVQRHYRETTPPLSPPIYKSALVGPDPAVSGLLFKIEPELPAGGEYFEVLDEGYDLASAYLNTTKYAAGKYELKLEFFKKVAGNMVRVNLTTEGVELYELDVAPFTETTYTALVPTTDRLYIPGGPGTDVMGYRLVIHIDNRVCFGTINDVVVNGVGAGQCGFLEYSHLTDLATISFRASHPGNFAVFEFDVYRVSTYLPNASAPGAGWVGDRPEVDELSVSGFNRAGDTFTKDVTIQTLMNDNLPPNQTACTRAAFAETLHVYALATNGYYRLDGYDGPRYWEDPNQIAVKAFAITPVVPGSSTS
jgi:hypothetical protein